MMSDDRTRRPDHLTAFQVRLLDGHGTEPPFSGEFVDHSEDGVYHCVSCGSALFASSTKFESDTPGLIGWPAFSDVIDNGSLVLSNDSSFGMQRIEVSCAQCGGHLGHYFDDPGAPDGRHYCVNSACLAFSSMGNHDSMAPELHSRVLRRVQQSLETGGSVADVLDLLRSNFEHYSWLGVYVVEGTDLVLTAWRGPQPTEHVRIPIGVGICGAAAASGQTEIVDDVSADGRYLACFPSTRSEIVIPIRKGDEIVGELDIDSDFAGAFNMSDRQLLEQIATLLGQLDAL